MQKQMKNIETFIKTYGKTKLKHVKACKKLITTRKNTYVKNV